MQKITPFLWFKDNAEEAMIYYTSVFKNSQIVSINRYPEKPTEKPLQGFDGKILNGIFELEGQRFMALDGGPVFEFTGAISLYVDCGSQEEVDYYWTKLSAVPEAEQCGWCKDKFGVSWQIIPREMSKMLNDPDNAKSGRVMQAMLQMKKIDIAGLKKAYENL